jgi:hypothetical protein
MPSGGEPPASGGTAIKNNKAMTPQRDPLRVVKAALRRRTTPAGPAVRCRGDGRRPEPCPVGCPSSPTAPKTPPPLLSGPSLASLLT